ncbi:Teneurin-2 [Manis pentadactyla]|nr:Teneurin-2 [Manis pentadactyla]
MLLNTTQVPLRELVSPRLLSSGCEDLPPGLPVCLIGALKPPTKYVRNAAPAQFEELPGAGPAGGPPPGSPSLQLDKDFVMRSSAAGRLPHKCRYERCRVPAQPQPFVLGIWDKFLMWPEGCAGSAPACLPSLPARSSLRASFRPPMDHTISHL